ncbi:hypothetical protein BKA56DRAFT_621351 [Ilyonectria sp. MPI-CAGE-AT-0026]|nr:hypothetical protein BKA56DRAFT_621351 [Ilyonectria sp. MPI-CAGE-AT-0026]
MRPTNQQPQQGRGNAGSSPLFSVPGRTTQNLASNDGSAPSNRMLDSSFPPQARTLGQGVPGFRTSFDVGGKGGGAFKPISENFSLISQRTTRGSRGRREILQDLTHTYDCVGRRVFTSDDSEQVNYFRGSRIKPEWDYTYDVAGRLVSASGRAQLSATPGQGHQLSPYDAMNGLSPSRGITDGTLLYQYVETYRYDREGNILQMKHDAPNARGVTGWTRSYFYEEQSLLSDGPVTSNRLSRTAIGSKDEGRHLYTGSAGLAGCMTTLPKFSELDWDMNNMLSFSSSQYVNAGTPERTYYVYDHSGNRVRKVAEAAARPGEEPRKQRDTLFLSGVELQRNNGSDLWIARVTGDDTLAMVEVSSTRQTPLVRFQTGDGIELDDQAQLVSYEEHSPFGAVVYSAVYGEVEAPRTYRFAKYEHDRETGLYHCQHRYYCPWLGRWTSPDPLGDVDGPNLYEYVKNDPVNSYDPLGMSKDDLSTRGKATEVVMEQRSVKRKTRVNNHRDKAGNSDALPNAVTGVLLDDGTTNMLELLKRAEPGIQLHHVYPQKFRAQFAAIGIDVDAYAVAIDERVHSICTLGGKTDDIELESWNKHWEVFLFNDTPEGYDYQMSLLDKCDTQQQKDDLISGLRLKASGYCGIINAMFGIDPSVLGEAPKYLP